MKCFSRGCRILLLLLPFILTLQEVYADGADNATSDAASEGQSTSGKTGPGSLIIDKVSGLVKSIENLALFRSNKYEHPQIDKESEALAFYLHGGKQHEEKYLKKSPIKSSGGN